MPEQERTNIKTYRVKNLTCVPTVRLLHDKLTDNGFRVKDITYGKLTLLTGHDSFNEELLVAILNRYGMDLIHDREEQLVEEIKIAVHELIHDLNNMNSIIRRSDFLVEKLSYSYSYLSKLFSAHEKITLEKYIIQEKIERIKELIIQDEYTLSEIAYMMGYSSVQYLSNQFRKITGEKVSVFKQRILAL
ncbi:MAG: helix-turn-helix transcriptional regulator [Chlorobi bacterium]|nr:helix-turn-helix transcriptional regulator [Chlorobiota bacterium]